MTCMTAKLLELRPYDIQLSCSAHALHLAAPVVVGFSRTCKATSDWSAARQLALAIRPRNMCNVCNHRPQTAVQLCFVCTPYHSGADYHATTPPKLCQDAMPQCEKRQFHDTFASHNLRLLYPFILTRRPICPELRIAHHHRMSPSPTTPPLGKETK